MSADLTKAFVSLSSDTHAVIEELLSKLYSSLDYDDRFLDTLEAWRAARGDVGRGEWRWWIGDVDDELYADDFGSEMEALAAGDGRYDREGKFRICEACCWADNVQEGDDELRFAAIRNERVVEVKHG